MKQKILMVSGAGLGNGGVESVIMSIVRSLSWKYQFDCVAFSGWPNFSYYSEEFENYGGHVFWLPSWDCNQSKSKRYLWKLSKDLYLGRKIRSIIKRCGPYRAIHCHAGLDSAIFLKVAAAFKIPIRIAHAHTLLSNKHRVKLVPAIIEKSHLKQLAKYANCRIACSKEAGSAFFAKQPYYVINNGINLQKFNPDNYSNGTISPSFIHIGRFCTDKNQIFVLEIFALLQQELHDASLSFVGFGPDEILLKDIVKNRHLKNVSFLPHDSDIPRLLSESFAMIFPSKSEGLGISAIEAQAMGLKVYCSDRVPKAVNLGYVDFLPLNLCASGWAKFIADDIKNNGLRRYPVDTSSFDVRNIMTKFDLIYSNHLGTD